MSLKLLVDEDTQARRLVEMLRENSHDVLTIGEAECIGIEAECIGISDEAVIKLARSQQRVLLNRNCDDFLTIHQTNSEHFGILAIYQNADAGKNMTYAAIVKAINNLLATEVSLKSMFIILNQYNW